jgi:adenylate cyclase
MKNKKWTNWIIKLGISFAIAGLVIILTQGIFFTITPLEELEQSHIDERFLNRGSVNIKDTADVVIVEITQDTYNGIPPPNNSWPWPRFIFAKAIENLTQAGAKVIGIDIIMSTPDKFSANNDSILFNTIRKNKNIIMGGKVETTQMTFSTQQLNEGINVDIVQQHVEIKKSDENYNCLFFKADSSVGMVNVVPDNDGVIRRYFPVWYSASNDNFLPSFGFAILNKYFKKPSDNLVSLTADYFLLNFIKIPRFDVNSMLINYYGPDRTFPHYNLLQIIDDEEFTTQEELEYETSLDAWTLTDKSLFKDKIVLIGTTIPEDKDAFPISFAKGKQKGDNLMYGVEIHANAIQNILSKDFLNRETKFQEILIVIIFSIISFFISSSLKEIKTKYWILLELGNFILIALSYFGLRMISFYLFNYFNFLFVFVSPLVAVVFGYIGSTVFHLISERKQKTMIKGMFSQYVSGNFVDELVANPEKLRLGGEQKELSVFFSDIAGFSTFSEKKTPEELVLFLNEYLSEMTRIVFDNQGTLDKYLGDAVMAFWGAPVPLKNHAYYACKAALEMRKRLLELQVQWRTEGQTVIDARMGINTGEMVVGNVGGSQKFDYTVIGDNVNLASRLEGANKEYGSNIMISENTFEQVKDEFITRELDFIIVKGKTKPIKVYELIGFKNEVLPDKILSSLQFYEKALEAYKGRDFYSAIEFLNESLKNNSEDNPSKVYLRRCNIYLNDPPDADWDGVFIMKTK